MMNIDIKDTASYQENGFWVAPRVLEDDELSDVKQGIEDVLDGFYDTGVEPVDTANDFFDAADTIRDINQVHLANTSIANLVHNTKLSEIIAAVTGANELQLWGSQLFIKPTGVSKKCNIGWHQDYFFHQKHFSADSNIFTVWIAISDVLNDCGPLRVVPGSNHWGFFDNQSAPREFVHSYIGENNVANWREQSLTMESGAFSIHDKMVFHGSYSNLSDTNRMSIAMRLRTEKSQLVAGSNLDLSDYEAHPILWQN